MGFVKNQEELDRYYAIKDRQFIGARMMGVMYETKPEVVARLLPPPLEPADAPAVTIFIAQYPETNLGPGYCTISPAGLPHRPPPEPSLRFPYSP